MTIPRQDRPDASSEANPDEEPLPSFAEQMADQLGGVRGLVESGLPVAVFVVVNLVADLGPALIASIGGAVAIAIMRLAQRRPIRYAVNGLVGVAIGAFLAYRSGEERDFYLPGIWYGFAYSAALLVSVAIKHPLVGWIWAMIANRGRADWRADPGLLRMFNRLTILWAVVWFAKVGVQVVLYLAHLDTLLGIARIALSTPVYALLLLITFWVVRRYRRTGEEATAGVA